MRVFQFNDNTVAFALNKIDVITFCEAPNGNGSKIYINVGYICHSIDFDSVDEGYERYKELVKELEEL